MPTGTVLANGVEVPVLDTEVAGIATTSSSRESRSSTASRGPSSPSVTLRRVKVVGWQFGSDGLDVVSSSRVRVVDSFLRDLDVIHTEHGAVLSIHNGDTATVSDVRCEDIRVEDARHKFIDVAIFLSRYSVDRPKDPAEIERRYLHGAWDGV